MELKVLPNGTESFIPMELKTLKPTFCSVADVTANRRQKASATRICHACNLLAVNGIVPSPWQRGR